MISNQTWIENDLTFSLIGHDIGYNILLFMYQTTSTWYLQGIFEAEDCLNSSKYSFDQKRYALSNSAVHLWSIRQFKWLF